MKVLITIIMIIITLYTLVLVNNVFSHYANVSFY